MTRALAWCVLIVACTANAEVKLPQGWRRPAAAQNEVCVRKGADAYLVTADFDGDGRADEARLLIKDSGRTMGLWIWMSDREPFLLSHWSDVRDGQHQLGMALVPPGASETKCSRWGDCQPGEPKFIRWTNPGIDLFWCESSNDFVWWDPKRQGFRSVRMTE